jgi:hypothetical protein
MMNIYNNIIIDGKDNLMAMVDGSLDLKLINN